MAQSRPGRQSREGRQPGLQRREPERVRILEKRLSRYMRPLMVPAPMRMAIVAPTRIRLRSSARSNSGTATRFSIATKANPEPTATARQARVASDTQPQSLPLLTASMNGASVSAINTVPA